VGKNTSKTEKDNFPSLFSFFFFLFLGKIANFATKKGQMFVPSLAWLGIKVPNNKKFGLLMFGSQN
jgi:hypothetical protein